MSVTVSSEHGGKLPPRLRAEAEVQHHVSGVLRARVDDYALRPVPRQNHGRWLGTVRGGDVENDGVLQLQWAHRRSERAPVGHPEGRVAVNEHGVRVAPGDRVGLHA